MPTTRGDTLAVFLSEVDHSPLLDSILTGLMEEEFQIRIYLVSQRIPQFLEKNELLIANTTILPDFRFFRRARLILFLSRRLRAEKPNKVFCSGRRAAQVGILAGTFCGVKNRIHIRHYGDIHHELPKMLSLLLDKLVNSLSTKIVAVSPSARKTLCDREKVIESKLVLIWNGVDFPRSTCIDRKPNTTYQILVVSRTEHYKNVSTIVKAYAKYVKVFPASKLVIIGAAGDDEVNVSHLLSTLPENSFERITHYTNSLNWLQKSDLFIHVPTGRNREAFGLVYIEGLLSGTQCIFSLSGILPDIPFVHDYVRILDAPSSDSLLNGMLEARTSPLPIFPENLQTKLKDTFSLDECARNYVALLKS